MWYFTPRYKNHFAKSYALIRRHTIVLDEDLEKKLRHLQADLIKKTDKSVSFSQVINETLKKGLK